MGQLTCQFGVRKVDDEERYRSKPRMRRLAFLGLPPDTAVDEAVEHPFGRVPAQPWRGGDAPPRGQPLATLLDAFDLNAHADVEGALVVRDPDFALARLEPAFDLVEQGH